MSENPWSSVRMINMFGGVATGCAFVAAASVPCVTGVHSVRLRAINPANFIPTVFGLSQGEAQMKL